MERIARDCIEITGIPVLPLDNPKQLVLELGSLIGVSISEDQISTAHRLPDTKKVQNRIIVKFVQRDKREEFYKKKKNLIGKKSSLLPSVQAEMGKSVFSDNKIHINESLTAYRKRLFGRINSFKQQHNHKFLWTANGKILLRETETSFLVSLLMRNSRIIWMRLITDECIIIFSTPDYSYVFILVYFMYASVNLDCYNEFLASSAILQP